ncbi:MAG: ferritin-like domain-containing protein [Geothrix sp.]|nr:ferritin-like domain-containing protein [Geothrix sp.]
MRSQVRAEHARVDARSTEDLADLLNQSLAETLDLAFQTEQARRNAKGQDAHELCLVFDHLHGQLATYVEDLDARAVTLCGQGLGALPSAQRLSSITAAPPGVLVRKVRLDDLVDSCGEYAGRMRKAIRKAEKLGQHDTADFYSSVSRDMDHTLWMLTAHEEA